MPNEAMYNIFVRRWVHCIIYSKWPFRDHFKPAFFEGWHTHTWTYGFPWSSVEISIHSFQTPPYALFPHIPFCLEGAEKKQKINLKNFLIYRVTLFTFKFTFSQTSIWHLCEFKRERVQWLKPNFNWPTQRFRASSSSSYPSHSDL